VLAEGANLFDGDIDADRLQLLYEAQVAVVSLGL
jgi:hypothetical protein